MKIKKPFYNLRIHMILNFVTFCCMIFVFIPGAFAVSKAGIVILSKGDFYAINQKSERRVLKRRSPVYPGDTLETGEESISQIRFIDNAVISLRPNTSLRIDEYTISDNTENKQENSVISILKGGFRTITGAIDKNNYTVNSEVASIGIRGTTYEVVLSDKLFVGTWQGGVSVKTKGGNLNLGKGAAYNFAEISDPTIPPSGLLFPPTILTPTSSPVFNKIGLKAPGDYKSQPINPTAFNNRKSVFNIITKKVNKIILNPTQLTNSTDISQLPSSPKIKDITNINFDRVGLAIISGINKPKFFGGRASAGAAGSPVISDNGFGPHELPMFYTATPNVALWRNSSSAVGVTTTSLTGSTQQISYGKWDTSAQPYPVIQVDPLGSASEIQVDTPIYWITAQATLPFIINSKTGSSYYDTFKSFTGSATGGNPNPSSIGINVNFDTNQIDGNLSFTAVSDVWTVNFQGDIKQNVLDVKVNELTSTVNSQPIKGQLPIIFSGESGQGVVGLFDLKQISDPNIHAQGVFSAEASGG